MNLFELGDATDANGFKVGTNTGTGTVFVQSKAAGTGVTASTVTALRLGVWAHVCGVFTSSVLRAAYLNGGDKQTNATSNVPAAFTNTRWFISTAASLGYSGSFAYPAIWNIALTDAEVYALAQGADPRTIERPNLISFLRFGNATVNQPDEVLASTWTQTGALGFVPDPFSLDPLGVLTDSWDDGNTVVYNNSPDEWQTWTANRGSGTWFIPAPVAQTISPTGIASGAAAGNPQLNLTVYPTGIASGAALGLPQLNFTIHPSGIASGAALGNPQLNFTIHPTGIASGAALGNPQLNLIIHPSGIVPSDAFGLAQLNQLIHGIGIASGMAFGLPTIAIAGSPQTITAFGIASLAALGLPALLTGPKTVVSASCSYTDVSAAVALASVGDTVVIPSGNCVWSNTLVVSQPIAIVGSGTKLARATGFIGPFFCGTGWNVPVFTVSGINFSLEQVAQHDHVGRIHAGKHLGGPYIGDVPNVWPGPLYAIVLPDLAHTWPNAGPTSWIDPNQPEND
jgi:hypothetical protein